MAEPRRGADNGKDIHSNRHSGQSSPKATTATAAKVPRAVSMCKSGRLRAAASPALGYIGSPSPITRKERWMGLGSTDVIGLAEARELARAARRLVTLGADPIEKRRETIQAERDAVIRDRASRMTFRQCADAFLHSHDKDRQWRVALDLAGAAFGDLPVGEIDTAMVVKFLEPHWRKTPVTASRHRGRIEAVLDWATVHKFREGDNPARWSGHLEHVFAAKPAARALTRPCRSRTFLTSCRRYAAPTRLRAR